MIVPQKKQSTRKDLSSLSFLEKKASLTLQRIHRPLFVKKKCLPNQDLNSLEMILAISNKYKPRTLPTMARLKEKNRISISINNKTKRWKQRRLKSEEAVNGTRRRQKVGKVENCDMSQQNSTVEDLRKKLKDWKIKKLKEKLKVQSLVLERY